MSAEGAASSLEERRWFMPAGAGQPVASGDGPTPAEAGRSLQSMLRPALARLPARREVFLRAHRHLAEAAALEVERGTLFLLVPVMIAIGALVYFGLPFEPGWLPVVSALGLASLAAALTPRATAMHHIAMGAILILAGVALAKAETWRAGTKMLGGEISTRVSGRIASIDHLANGRVRLTLDVLSTQRPKLRYAPDRVRVTARNLPEALEADDVVEAAVRLRPPPGPVRPGSYDFSFESYFDGIGASGFVLSGPFPAPGDGDDAPGWAAGIENARTAIAARIRSRIGGAEGEIAAALMVGVRAGIPVDASEALRRTGLYHVISISGLHMALVAGTVIGAIRAIFALFPTFSARRPVRKYAALGGIAAITCYLVISGGDVATQRSYVMLTVMLAAWLFDRAALTMRNLAISAIVVLVVTPHEVVGPSFQMSFAATAALVGAYALWSERRSPRATDTHGMPLIPAFAGRLVKIAAGLLLTSLVAGLATAAFGAYHFQRVSPLSLVANLVAMPIVSLVVVPSALVASVLMPLGLDGPFLTVMGWGLSLMLAVARWFSDRTPLDAVGLVSGHGLAFLTIALTVGTVATTRLRWAALPFALAGLMLLPTARHPDVLVAEDGALTGFRTQDGRLAVNRQRPNGFTVDSWKRALDAEAPVGPTRSEVSQQPAESVTGAFACDDRTCTATLPSGDLLVHTADAEVARLACGSASAIVLDDATLPLRCADPAVVVITKRQLARHGSAAIFLGRYGSPAEVAFAAAADGRPWHDHRRFSREARGKAPYQRKPRDQASSKPEATAERPDLPEQETDTEGGMPEVSVDQRLVLP